MSQELVVAQQNFFTLKDWIYLAGLVIAAGSFVWKLIIDTSLARYRETVAFIEKREKDMRERWQSIRSGTLASEELESEIYVFTGQLELVSLLVRRKIFDAELVYNYWWRYFDEPLQNAQINTWIALHREADASVLEHYVFLCKSWSNKLDVELGRESPSSKRWWKFWASH